MGESKHTSGGGGGVGCVVHIVAWTALVGVCLWLFAGYSPEEAITAGLAFGVGWVCVFPLVVLGGLFLLVVLVGASLALFGRAS